MVQRGCCVLVIARQHRIDGEGQQMVGTETHIDRAKVLHGAHEEPCAEEQQHTQTDLYADEDLLDPGLPCRRGAYLLFQSRRQVGTPELQRRYQAEHQSG